MSGDVVAAPRRGGADRWLPLASFATCTFYVFLVGFLAMWVVVPALVVRWDPMVVTSGSMAPLIRTGDVVLTSAHDGADLDAGTVITYRDGSRDGALVTHRIAAVNEDGTYTTRGDANQSTDPTPVRPEDVEGVGRLLVPMIGVPVTWLAAGNLATFAIWAVMTAVAAAIATRAPEDPEETDDPDRPEGGAPPEVLSPGRARRALRLVNLPALLQAVAAPIRRRSPLGRGPVPIPPRLRSWAPLVLVTVATVVTGREPLGLLAGVATVTVVLSLDPKGPHLPVGRWLRSAAAARTAVARTFGGVPGWRPAVAGVAIVAVLALSVVPRSAAAFTADAVNSGNSWRSTTWTTLAPTDIAVPSCTREGGYLAVVLSWQPPTGAEPDGYVVQQAVGDRVDPYTDLATVPDTTHDLAVDGLTNNVWYFFRVRSKVGSFTSDPSPVVGVRIRGQECDTQ